MSYRNTGTRLKTNHGLVLNKHGRNATENEARFPLKQTRTQHCKWIQIRIKHKFFRNKNELKYKLILSSNIKN